MSILDDLRNGKLSGARSLTLSCGLSAVPEELLALADSLEILDLNSNLLTELPDWFSQLRRLRILFLSFNRFSELPAILSRCSALEMLGARANQISVLPSDSLPSKLRWLILTDNQLVNIPASIGSLARLEKFAISGNRISELPDEMSQCTNLALLRLAANRLRQVPEWLFRMPKLAWLTLAGNPCCSAAALNLDSGPAAQWGEIALGAQLGAGASGVTHQAVLCNPAFPSHIAVKIFKGELSSDGYADDECLAHRVAGRHPALLTAIGEAQGVPGGKRALILPLLNKTYRALGQVPTFESCSRDSYPEGADFSLRSIYEIASRVAAAALHLHRRQIMHGDLYAHNILSDQHGQCLLGDLGAASLYGTESRDRHRFYERLDVLAYGYLLQELLERCSERQSAEAERLGALAANCCVAEVGNRPGFSDIIQKLR